MEAARKEPTEKIRKMFSWSNNAIRLVIRIFFFEIAAHMRHSQDFEMCVP